MWKVQSLGLPDDFMVCFNVKGELNPEMKLSQSIELFWTKRLPPFRNPSDVWFSSCASWKSAATPPQFGRDTPFWRHWHSDRLGKDRGEVVFRTFRKIWACAFLSRVVPRVRLLLEWETHKFWCQCGKCVARDWRQDCVCCFWWCRVHRESSLSAKGLHVDLQL